jgi:hypothetical protein
MDNATNEHYSMFFVDEEGTAGSFQGIRDGIVKKGLFRFFYTDRGSHYGYIPKELPPTISRHAPQRLQENGCG